MLWTRKSRRPSAGRQVTSARRLHVEILENRLLLAVAAFDFNFYEAEGGTPGEPITSDRVMVGDEFYVEIVARDFHPWTGGLRGVSLDIAWDPDVLQAVAGSFDLGTVITRDLPTFQQGTLDNDAGTIDNLSGAAILSSNLGRAIGNWAPERFALLHFRALTPAVDSLFTMHEGRSRIVTVPTATFSSAQLDFEAQTITVIPRPIDADPPESAEEIGGASETVIFDSSLPNSASSPQIQVSSETGGSLASIQFTTLVTESAGATEIPLVRPAFVDDDKFIDVTNSGDSPLTIFEVQVNAPDVTVHGAPISSDDGSVVIGPGQTERFELTYAPSTPNAADATVQSFDIADGVVILSNAENAPVVEVGLRGDSTFDGDTNYDGRVDLADLISFDAHYGLAAGDDGYLGQIDPNGDGVVDFRDLRPIAAHFHHSRELPVVGPVQSAVLQSAEGEGQANQVSSPNACVAAPAHSQNVSSTPQDASPRVVIARVRPASFVGPLPPREVATHLLLAEPADQLTSAADPNQLDDELTDLLAADVNSQFDPSLP